MSTLKMHLVGKQITAARRLLGMSQSQLAEAAGVAEQTIIRFEKEQHEPRPETIEAIRDVLETRGIEFINGIGPGVRLNLEKAGQFARGAGGSAH